MCFHEPPDVVYTLNMHHIRGLKCSFRTNYANITHMLLKSKGLLTGVKLVGFTVCRSVLCTTFLCSLTMLHFKI